MIYLLGGVEGFLGQIGDSFKENILDDSSLVYIPTSFEDEAITDTYVKLTNKWFNEAGVFFKKCQVLKDSDCDEVLYDKLKNADVVYLMGGNPFIQMNFIKKRKLQEHLHNKILIGNSAGALNLSKSSLTTSSLNNVYYGLNLSSGINIDVHYTSEKDKYIIAMQKTFNINEIIAIPEESGILIKDDHIKVLGKSEVTIFKSGLKEVLNNCRVKV